MQQSMRPRAAQLVVTLLLLAALTLALWRIQTLRRELTQQPQQWQFPSHRDPTAQVYYMPQRQFFYEDAALNSPEKVAVAQCYRAHCTEEGARASGNYENYSTSRQKGCSNYDYQDVSVFQALFLEPLRYGGVFVELGAMTGWGASNTLFFEHCLNWTGALFDVSTDNYGQMLKNRPSPTTHKVLGTVCERPGHVYVARSAAGCCGKVAAPQATDDNDAYSVVPCKPMSDWLRELGITAIDYFSLDTEGYEYEVLRTMDWRYNSVRVLSVEMLDRELVAPEEFENQARIRQLLGSVGLTYVPWLSVARDSLNRDEIWVNLSWPMHA